MNIISEILLAGYDIKIESASWVEFIKEASPETQKLLHFKLEIKQHNGEFLCLGAVSPETLEKTGDKIILDTLESMWDVLEKE